MGSNAFWRARSRPIMELSAISAPARSIEAHARSISRLRMTSRIETWWTSTSYIDFSTESGSMPCDMVRLPCGSRSAQSTRWPSSARATARFNVVVVLATPPFWFANAMTLALFSTEGSAFSSGKPVPALYSHVRYGFLHAYDSPLGRRALRSLRRRPHGRRLGPAGQRRRLRQGRAAAHTNFRRQAVDAAARALRRGGDLLRAARRRAERPGARRLRDRRRRLRPPPARRPRPHRRRRLRGDRRAGLRRQPAPRSGALPAHQRDLD